LIWQGQSGCALSFGWGRFSFLGFVDRFNVEHGHQIACQLAMDVEGPAGPDEVGKNFARMHETAIRLTPNGVSDRLRNLQTNSGHPITLCSWSALRSSFGREVSSPGGIMGKCPL